MSSLKDYPDRMSADQARAFRHDVLSIVGQIPRGSVTTYGIIATLCGWPSHSRMVGRTLRYTPEAASLPCHRVVNAAGRTAPGWSRQRPLLEAEGVSFRPNGHVDMARHLWKILMCEKNSSGATRGYEMPVTTNRVPLIYS